MNIRKVLIITLLAGLSLASQAQYSQLGKKNEFMLKTELGYGPFMGNVGTAGDHGYYLNKFYSMIDLNVLAGLNISQDWFLGGGAGFGYYHSPNQNDATSLMGANVFVDFDFRPVWKAVMGLDYQPRSIKWAPEMGARVGGSLLLGESERYGTTFSPLAEVYLGVNWYYWYAIHGMKDMERNWHSFYLTVGLAYLQQTVFLPVRLGWRW